MHIHLGINIVHACESIDGHICAHNYLSIYAPRYVRTYVPRAAAAPTHVSTYLVNICVLTLYALRTYVRRELISMRKYVRTGGAWCHMCTCMCTATHCNIGYQSQALNKFQLRRSGERKFA